MFYTCQVWPATRALVIGAKLEDCREPRTLMSGPRFARSKRYRGRPKATGIPARLDRVRAGDQVVIEHDARPVAVLRPASPTPSIEKDSEGFSGLPRRRVHLYPQPHEAGRGLRGNRSSVQIPSGHGCTVDSLRSGIEVRRFLLAKPASRRGGAVFGTGCFPVCPGPVARRRQEIGRVMR